MLRMGIGVEEPTGPGDDDDDDDVDNDSELADSALVLFRDKSDDSCDPTPTSSLEVNKGQLEKDGGVGEGENTVLPLLLLLL